MVNETIDKQKKVIFFDMYQTLVDTDVENHKELVKNGFEKIFLPYLINQGFESSRVAQFQILYNQEQHNFYKIHDKETEHHDFVYLLSDTFKKHYNFDIDKRELGDLVYEFRKVSRGYVRLYPDVPEMLQILSRDYALILASYTQGAYSERELKELDIRKYFTHCVFSSDIGYKKKSYKFYKKCLEIAQSDPKNCIMVGDDLYDDIYMPKQSGVRAVWIINSLTKDTKVLDIIPDASLSIESISTLPEVIVRMYKE